MIGAPGLMGLLGVMTIVGGTDAAVFEAFVSNILAPKLVESRGWILMDARRASTETA